MARSNFTFLGLDLQQTPALAAGMALRRAAVCRAAMAFVANADVIATELYLRSVAEGRVRKKRSCWVSPVHMRREEQGDFHHLGEELRADDPVS